MYRCAVARSLCPRAKSESPALPTTQGTIFCVNASLRRAQHTSHCEDDDADRLGKEGD
jgi:hypothetical protein